MNKIENIVKIKDIIERHNRMYTASIYGSVEGVAHQRDCDFEELVQLFEKLELSSRESRHKINLTEVDEEDLRNSKNHVHLFK